jgi:hypothetical protein
MHLCSPAASDLCAPPETLSVLAVPGAKRLSGDRYIPLCAAHVANPVPCLQQSRFKSGSEP